MTRAAVVLACLLTAGFLSPYNEEQHSSPSSFDYQTASEHEVKPHRRIIPLNGVRGGFNHLQIALTVSRTGDVVNAEASGQPESLKFWPQVGDEVRQWKFTPFEQNGETVTAEVVEYVDLVPPERLPKTHVVPPALLANSKVTITLVRTGCFGACPSYTVRVGTDGVEFAGSGYVVAAGKHRDGADANAVRQLAKKIVAAEFYSMDSTYRASVTDHPSYALSIAIDGHTKKVEDYLGWWVGMPAIISTLEDEVDTFARTERWIDGGDGLVQALQAEKFNFKSFEAQVMLKQAARRGKTATVQEFLDAGVPLEELRPAQPAEPNAGTPFEYVGLLTGASRNGEALQILIRATASKNNQSDKDLALAGAAASGNVEAVRALIGYGADPNADLGKQVVEARGLGVTIARKGEGSVLISAASSGNPEVVREILGYHPDLEARDQQGRTAVLAAAEYGSGGKPGTRLECLRLLVQAGANVNARNHEGETPIFTTVDDAALSLFIEHGADLTIRNKKGETVIEAARDHGPDEEEALRKAILKLSQ